MEQNNETKQTPVEETQSMNSEIQTWCNKLENRLTKSLNYVDFWFAYQRTNGKDLTRSLEAISNRVNSKTEWVTTWLDIWAKHAHEKNGFNKILRECTKVNKTKAKEREKQERQQQQHTLQTCSCGALLSRNKMAKHMKTKIHEEALSKKTTQPDRKTEIKEIKKRLKELEEPEKTPTEKLTERLEKLENEIETAIAKAKEENAAPPVFTQGSHDQRAKPKVTIVNVLNQDKTTKDPLVTYWKFPCRTLGKEPAVPKGTSWKDPANQQKPAFNPQRFNTGIPCGTRNNLLVVDLDVKDEGVREFRKYRREFGTPQTLTVQTPTKGYHYYFNYSHEDPDCQAMIKAYLGNKTKFRGKGIDIRSEGGYVVAPPSVRAEGDYEVTNNRKPTDIPSSLISWLLEGGRATEGSPKAHKAKASTPPLVGQTGTVESDFDFAVNPELATTILAELDPKYQCNFSDWFLVTGILKQHGLKEVWNTWSQQAANYNQEKNEQIWNSSKGILDINYLVWVLRKAGSERDFIAKWKPFHPITQDLTNVKQITFNKPFVSEGLSRETFENYETIIIKSCTGTGKTTAIAKHMEKHPEKETTFLSITTRTSLADQHEKSFTNLNMKNYQDLKTDIYDTKCLSVCLNSLIKLECLEEEDIAKYVVYIDEVSSFTEFTENDLLDNRLKKIVGLLTRLMKHAKKVIVSDALINDATFELLKHRPLNKTVFLTNEFQKFEGVQAIRLRNEREFLDKLVEHVNSNQPFLFGCDSCNVVTAFYHHCLEHVVDQSLKDKFLLITAETGLRVKDASKEFEGRFVFYSPKITFGVDFSTLVAQDVFIHITGNSIQPSGSFQQTTRCRNIKTVYYFGECTENLSFYNSLDEVRVDVEQALQTSKTFNSTCTYLDEFDNVQVVQNTFFNLYCLNEFARDTFASNKLRHFEMILEQNGFKLSQQGDKEKVDVATMLEVINENLFEDYLAEPKNESNWRQNPKYQQLLHNINYLKLDPSSNETLKHFQNTVTNRWNVQEHDATVRFLRSEAYVDCKIGDLGIKCLELKAMTNCYQKVKFLRALEAKWGITLFGKEVTTFTKLEEHTFKMLSRVFTLRRANPTTSIEAGKFYSSIANKIAFKNMTRATKEGITWNMDALKNHLELNSHKNTNRTGFQETVYQTFGFEPVSLPQGLFADELDA